MDGLRCVQMVLSRLFRDIHNISIVRDLNCIFLTCALTIFTNDANTSEHSIVMSILAIDCCNTGCSLNRRERSSKHSSERYNEHSSKTTVNLLEFFAEAATWLLLRHLRPHLPLWLYA